MSGSVKLTVSRSTAKKLKLASRTLKKVDATCYGEHTAKVTLKVAKSVARKLVKAAKRKRVKLSLAVQMLDWGKPAQTITRTITLGKK